MRLVAALVAAAVTSLVLTAVVAVVHVATDPEIRDCAAAVAAVDAANRAHQDQLQALDYASVRARRDGPEAAGVPVASLRADQTKHELEGARDEFTLLCHYPDPSSQPPTATAPTPRELP
jgi:hypothetical protein